MCDRFCIWLKKIGWYGFIWMCCSHVWRWFDLQKFFWDEYLEKVLESKLQLMLLLHEYQRPYLILVATALVRQGVESLVCKVDLFELQCSLIYLHIKALICHLNVPYDSSVSSSCILIPIQSMHNVGLTCCTHLLLLLRNVALLHMYVNAELFIDSISQAIPLPYLKSL